LGLQCCILTHKPIKPSFITIHNHSTLHNNNNLSLRNAPSISAGTDRAHSTSETCWVVMRHLATRALNSHRIWRSTWICRGYVGCLGGYISVRLMSCSTTTGALGSPGLLLPCSLITISSHINIILIIIHLSNSNP